MAVSKRTCKTKSGELRTTWVVRYYDADGKYRMKTFKREREAKAWEAQTKVDLKKGIHRPDSDSATVSEAASLWLDRCKDDVERGTHLDYTTCCRLHILPATAPENVPNGWKGKLGDLKLSRLTSPICETFAQQLVKKNARATALKVLTRFKTMLRDAQRRGLIGYNPASPVRIKTNNRNKVRIQIGEHIPSKEDLRAILKCATGQWYPLILTAAFTGMRTSELRALTWKNVDFERRVIHVRQRVDRFGDLGPCKSASGHRDIQISDEVAEALRRWKSVCPPGAMDLVFPNDAGKLANHTSGILIPGWWPIQQRVGITAADGEAKYKFHSLRHFFASIMIEQGTSAKRLQDLLGHATITMTMDRYGHLFPPSENEIARLNSAVASVLVRPDNGAMTNTDEMMTSVSQIKELEPV